MPHVPKVVYSGTGRGENCGELANQGLRRNWLLKQEEGGEYL